MHVAFLIFFHCLISATRLGRSLIDSICKGSEVCGWKAGTEWQGSGNTETWHWGTRPVDNIGGRWMVGRGDLEVFSKPHDLMILWSHISLRRPSLPGLGVLPCIYTFCSSPSQRALLEQPQVIAPDSLLLLFKSLSKWHALQCQGAMFRWHHFCAWDRKDLKHLKLGFSVICACESGKQVKARQAEPLSSGTLQSYRRVCAMSVIHSWSDFAVFCIYLALCIVEDAGGSVLQATGFFCNFRCV